MTNLAIFERPKQVQDYFSVDAEIVLRHGEVKDFLATVPDNTASLIVTSPPYNIGKEYEDRVSIDKYLEVQSEVIAQLYRVLREDGSICWQVGEFR